LAAPAEGAAAPAFVPVRVTAEPPPVVAAIVLSGGERIELRADAPMDLVRTAVAALRASC
jgi:hypothetical protein